MCSLNYALKYGIKLIIASAKNIEERTMKKHAIIPIFIPHEGCPNDCVFCNKRTITAKSSMPSPADARKTIDQWLSTLSHLGASNIEIAFYGGSFTGLPIEVQNQYLDVAMEAKDAGKIGKIHLSTRPDYIDEEILENLKTHKVDIIELGVQSFVPEVLAASRRGHTVGAVYTSTKLIKEYDFTLGIQLMVGLPESNLERDVYSAKETVKIAPEIARLYPTIVIKDTQLMEMYTVGTYNPLSQDEAVYRTAAMHRILTSAGINVIRIGLKSSDLIEEGKEIAGGTFHPAFRQLVEGQIAREDVEMELMRQLDSKKEGVQSRLRVTILSSPRSFSNLIGNSRCNKIYFEEKYPHLSFKFGVNGNLTEGKYVIILLDANNT